MAAVNAAYNAAAAARSGGLGPAEMPLDPNAHPNARPKGMPGAGAGAAAVGAAGGKAVEKEDGQKTSRKELIAALKKMKAQSNPEGLFYRLYPQPETKNSEQDMERWCRRAAARIEEDDDDEDEDAGAPTDSVMSGAVAALAFVHGYDVDPGASTAAAPGSNGASNEASGDPPA
eukprot:CAMPEP_0179263818 /NCGR_PEP_ID=MMETSP0797-20121207/28073_1 /TAXON_ID=47934 /ORGANISM="Dinophysis acuminata, Strain DAEP01" /LENGTH=173 /DNA_ID=CAMNT_0020971985 /DNA_START=59 /DNA_END=576 /DNA_ORIENTATION=-